MDWQITGLGSFDYISGSYSSEAALTALLMAREQAKDWYEFDQMVEGRGPGMVILSGSQLLAKLEQPVGE